MDVSIVSEGARPESRPPHLVFDALWWELLDRRVRLESDRQSIGWGRNHDRQYQLDRASVLRP